MKNKISLILACIALSGCATPIHYTSRERCALGGLKLAGVDVTDSSAVAYNWKSNSTTTVNESSKSIRCDVIKTEEERKENERILAIAEPKVKYNDTVDGKRLINGIGYCLWIVPGILAKVVFDVEYDKAVKESDAIARQPASVAPVKTLP